MDVNFSELTSEVLSSYGYSEAQLAKQLGTTQVTVHRIKTGATKNPGYLIGAELVRLHEQRPEPDAAA